MTETPRLSLPYLASNQAQKHVTLNESLRRLDALVQMSLASRTLDTPPSGPVEGEGFIVPDGADAAWGASAGSVLVWQDGAWAVFSPRAGWRAWIVDEARLLVHDGAGWILVSAEPGPVSELGVNTSADAVNRLAVKSDAVLLSHDDVTPGSGNVRLVLNKASEPRAASLVFQSNWSGRAEFGLTGEDDFAVKVSADGAAFADAIRIERATGRVSFPATPVSDVRRVVLASGSGTYVVPEGVKALNVCVIGAGGGGAGAETVSSSVFVGAAGGGAGGVVVRAVPMAALAASYTYSVGAGGAGGSGAPGDPVGTRSGGQGGDSRFETAGLALVAGGGRGAIEDTAAAGATEFVGGSGGSASGGDINWPGQRGSGGITKASEFYQIGIGEGAAGPFGQGGTYKNGNGSDGVGYGSGGSGCGMIPGFVLNRAGGDGAPGAILIDEYY